ncbi:Conserved_hypothetical protein [Hexamita inflata]|uniref:Transmembrane protein n=1 Tax=Hexamita inflata TaxID=28002 RepID=A0AA86RNW5_9EUKA|nr:Conserved hypothetical protein [Hexamita inflata]
MIIFIYALNLLCFQTNTTVILDVQTRQLIFNAFPRTDDSRELKVCKQLNGDMYKLSVQTGTFNYVLSSLQQYDYTKEIEIRIPCDDLVTNCNSAFKAKSAIYTMEFQEAKQTITEAASNLRRLDFNRKACINNVQLLYGQNLTIPVIGVSDIFQISGTPSVCKYPLDSQTTIDANNPLDKKAMINFYAYPSFQQYSPQYSLKPAQMLQNSKFPCVMMPTAETIAWCKNMVQTLATSSFGYLNMQYIVPGKIPNRDGTLTRVGNYISVYQSNQVKNALQATFDCYSSQSIKLYGKSLLLTNTMNPAMVYCSNPMSAFIPLSYDKMVTRVSFQEFEDFRTGQVFTLDFTTPSQVLNSSFEWLSCSDSVNETYCEEVLQKSSTISSYYLNAQQLIYKNNQIVKIYPLTTTLQTNCYMDSSASVSNDQVCVSVTNVCSGQAQSNQQFIYSFPSLNITSQAPFPNTENKYCAKHQFDSITIQQLVNQRGVVLVNDLKIQISSVTDDSVVKSVKNIQWFVLGTAVFIAVFVGLSVWKPWV